MGFDEFLKRVDEQIAAKAAMKRGDRRTRERRAEAVPVLEDRRHGERRNGDRRAKRRD
jgi:hypothetical protein